MATDCRGKDRIESRSGSDLVRRGTDKNGEWLSHEWWANLRTRVKVGLSGFFCPGFICVGPSKWIYPWRADSMKVRSAGERNLPTPARLQRAWRSLRKPGITQQTLGLARR